MRQVSERSEEGRARARPGGAPAGLRRHLPAIVVTVLIAALLLVTRGVVVALLERIGGAALVPLADEIFGPQVQQGGDKIVHALLFFVHTATLIRSLVGTGAVSSGVGLAARAVRLRVLLAGLVSLLYSGTLEILQGPLGRHEDLADLAANAFGIALCVAWSLVRRPRDPAGAPGAA